MWERLEELKRRTLTLTLSLAGRGENPLTPNPSPPDLESHPQPLSP